MKTRLGNQVGATVLFVVILVAGVALFRFDTRLVRVVTPALGETSRCQNGTNQRCLRVGEIIKLTQGDRAWVAIVNVGLLGDSDYLGVANDLIGAPEGVNNWATYYGIRWYQNSQTGIVTVKWTSDWEEVK